MTIDPQWDFDALPGNVRTVEDNVSAGDATNSLIAQMLAHTGEDQPVLEAPENPYIRLPGGLYWDGELLRTAEVRELTGEDEEALAAVRGSLARWLSVLLERTVVRIGDLATTPQMVKKLLIGDRDELLLGVRIATFGRMVTLRNITCPHCEGELDATVDLSTVDRNLLENPQPRHEYQVALQRGGTAVFRLPDGAAQESTFGSEDLTAAQRDTRLLAQCLVRVTDSSGQPVGKSGEALARHMGMADRQTVITFMAERQPGPLLNDIRFMHDGCGQEVRLPLELPELFRI